MAWRHTAAVLAAASIPFVVGDDDRPLVTCAGPFDATFVQIGFDQLAFDEAQWRRELEVLHRLGVELVIVQFTGDEHGPYDRDGRAPVAALLAAARGLRMRAMLGLHDDPTWPSDEASDRLAPPLDDVVAATALGELCRDAPACAGWYVSQEIDDETWSSAPRTHALRGHIARTARALRELAPGKRIALAPFFTGVLGADEYARWWQDVLEPGAIDILMLQDGVGSRRATAEVAAAYLAELRAPLAESGVELWAVTEVFDQMHGPPIDEQPFEAIPIDPVRLRHSLAIEAPLVERVVAFALLDYMDPRRSAAAQKLYDEYAAGCRAAHSTWRSSC